FGSAMNTTGLLPPPFQYCTNGSHSCCGGAGRRSANCGNASPIHTIGRRRSRFSRRSIARIGAELAAAACVRRSSSRRNAGAFCRENAATRSEEHTSELQSPYDIVCRLLLEKK